MNNSSAPKEGLRPAPPDLNSYSKLEEYIKRYGSPPIKMSDRAKKDFPGGSGLGLLQIALNRLRRYSYPSDQPDWTAIRNILNKKGGPKPRRKFKPRITASPGFWKFNGPKNLAFGASDLSGRVSAIAIDPTDSNTIYVGAPAGGVWKSADGGLSWTPLSNSWPFQAVSSVAIAPDDPQTIYVGTGDFANWSNQCFGLMKSTDGGVNFTNLAVAEAGEFSISSIIIDPDQTNIITIACGRGRSGYGQVWRSLDYGQTWGAAPVITQPAEWAQVAISQADIHGFRWYYAVGWIYADVGLLYRSADRGATWTALNAPWGAPQYGISVAPSEVDPKTVYVLAGSDMKVLSSPDSGVTWNDITGNLTQVGWDWNQLTYDWYLVCAQIPGSAADSLFLGLKHLFIGNPATKNWTILPSGHDDQHCMTPDPNSSGRFFIGNDGGAWALAFSLNLQAWQLTSLNASLGITQFYESAYSPLNRQIMLGAAQDNSLDVAEGDLEHWRFVGLPRSGDSVAAVVSQTNPKVQFSAVGVLFYGIARTPDQWATEKEITPPLQGDYVSPFSTILAMDEQGTTLYWGTDYLWAWNDTNQVWSAHLGNQRLSMANESSIRTLGVAPSNGARVYTGSDDGLVWVGQGPSWAWRQINVGANPLPNAVIGAISVNPNNPDDVLVGIGTSGPGIGHIWRCSDVSAVAINWTNQSGSGSDALPDLPVNAIARHPLNPEMRIFAATDVGVFESDDGGDSWQDITIAYGLPRTPVNDLQVTECYLHAATFGRGIWTAHLEFTDVAPVATSIGNTLFVIAKGISGRIFISQAILGDSFSPWIELPGNGRTDAAPCVTAVGNSVFVFVKGLDGFVYLNQADFSNPAIDPASFVASFSGWFQVPGNGQTDVAPTTAAIGNHVFVFIKGLDNRIYVNQADLGGAFGEWFEVQGDGMTDAAPSAAVIEYTVFVFVKGLDDRIYLNQADLGHAFGYWFEVQGNGITDTAPAAASIEDSLFVFVKGIDGRIYLNQADYREAFGAWFEVQGNGMSDVAPGAGSVEESLFVFVKGLDGSPAVNQAELRHAFSGWFPMSNDTP